MNWTVTVVVLGLRKEHHLIDIPSTILTDNRHDDITYQSIAKGFGLPLKLNETAFEKMKRLSKPHPSQPKFDWETDSPALKAKLRMVELPTDETRDPAKQFLFPFDDLWVPVAVVNGNVHILPGVPRICKPDKFEVPVTGIPTDTNVILQLSDCWMD